MARNRTGFSGMQSIFLLIILLALVPAGQAQGEWEMRVCARPHALPMSHEDMTGYDIEIAKILADELGAELTVEWSQFDDLTFQRTIHRGLCDVAIGVAEDAGGLLTTVPYLRTPYVFLERTDNELGVESLDDERLREIRIGTYQTALPSIALRNRGITSNVTEYPPVPSPGGPDREFAIVEALLAGEVDLAIIYGPAAAHWAGQNPGQLQFRAVQPEIDIGESLLQFSRTWTIGVRPQDEAFRDRLNIALANRWEDIQQAIADYGVPQLPISRPVAGQPDEDVRVALVGPISTPSAPPEATLAQLAMQGTGMAQNIISASDGLPTRVLLANAPTDEAIERAARRLVATENPLAIAGGFTDEQAIMLSDLAQETGTVFLNIGALSPELRDGQSRPFTFNIEVDASRYAGATAAWHVEQGRSSWILVHEDTPEGERLGAETAATLERLGARQVEVRAIDPDGFVFIEVTQALGSARFDAALLLVRPELQEKLITQVRPEANGPVIVGLSYPQLQTRAHWFNLASDSAVRHGARPVLWDARIDGEEAAAINERFLSRTGAPAESSAWSAFAAALIAHQAATEGASTPGELADYLRDPAASFELGKGQPLTFDPAGQQLMQPIYMAQLAQDAAWSRLGPERVEMVNILQSLDLQNLESALLRSGQD